MIQGVISRMSSFSATAKNFAVTVSVAIAAVTFEKESSALFWAGAVAVIAFLVMDGYYHLLEVRFRELYRTTALLPIEPVSDMLLDAPKATRANVWKVLTSATLLPFYVLLLFALFLVLKDASVHATKDNTVAVAARDGASASGQNNSPTKRIGGPVEPAKANNKHADGSARPSVSAEAKRAGSAR